MVSEILLEQFSNYVADRIGLHFPKQKWRDLERCISNTSKELGFKGVEAFLRHALSSSLTEDQAEALVCNLTIGETHFFRENRIFKALEDLVIPGLISSPRGEERRLRVWSAGCCTGEEPYSLAILLSRVIPRHQNWNITILATDINPRFLEFASRAIYRDWSFRDAPPWLKEKYFTGLKNGGYRLIPEIRKMVTFSRLNLVDDGYPSLLNNTFEMDIIFCRNVLMYFTPGQSARVIKNLHKALVEGGWLVVSSFETSAVIRSGFNSVNLCGSTFHRKKSRTPIWQPLPDGAGPESLDESPEPQVNLTDSTSESLPEVSFPAEPWKNELLKVRSGPAQPSRESGEAESAGRPPEKPGAQKDLLQAGEESRPASLLARSCADQGLHSEALDWCRKAIAENKLDPRLYFLQATILLEQGEREAAAASLKQALFLDQDFALAHYALANLSLRQGKSKQAGKHFKNALSLLQTIPSDTVLPESEGITAGRLLDIIQSTLPGENHP